MANSQTSCEDIVTFTRHAERQAVQRGIREDTIDAVIAEGDNVQFIGKGCVAISTSRTRIRELIAEGVARTTLEAMKDLAIVMGSNNRIVTVMRLKPGARGRHYRRGRG